ncbi:TspO/MBR family protein [Streptomyces sp. NPDC002886]|uniref:TspO/MBR family protein n=1 Tax=Streptomyces sp. NPDC002886 TaxID=3364667 RepID=UPI0036B26DEE
MKIYTSSASAPDGRHGAKSRWACAAFLTASYGVAAIGAITSADAGEVYGALARPAWAPPAWLFGPVWTVLYAAIGVAAWLVWRQPDRYRGRRALMWWSVQLVLNLAWTPLFFAARQYGLALLDIVLLLAAIVTTMLHFRRLSVPAALLLVPYALWVAFATALNASVWSLNT